MKKTITTAALVLGLAVSSSAATLSLDNAVFTDLNVTSTTASTINAAELWSDTANDSYTVTFTLNVDTLADLIGSTATATSTYTSLVKVTSNGNTIGMSIGAAGTGSSDFNGLTGTWNQTGDNTNAGYQFTAYATTPSVARLGSVDMSNIASAAATLVHDNTNATRGFLTLITNEGTILNYYGANTSLKASGGIGDIQSMTFNNELITSIYLMEGASTGGNPNALAQAAIEAKAAASIPEPATATLSLLALAGLAARRRRK